MAPLSFVRSILVLSLLSSVLSRPTHIIRPHHKRCPTGALPHILSTTSNSTTPITLPAVTLETADPTAYGAYDATKSTKTTTKANPTSSVTEEEDPQASPPPDTPGDGAPSGGSSRIAALIPLDRYKRIVSFSDAVPGHKPLDALPVGNQAKTSKYTIGTFEGRAALSTTMNKGSISPGQGITGGISFYSSIPEFQSASKYIFAYSVFFEEGFEFNKGGKLPGTYGGTTEDIARGCSGGKNSGECMSTRLMFRENGAGELYVYLPRPTDEDRSFNKNDQICGSDGHGQCEGIYGASVGRGSWTWPVGKWVTVAQEIHLNTPGKADGKAVIWIDGEQVFEIGGLVFRRTASVKPYGLQMQTFFGGHTDEWASPKDQDILFSDMTISVED